MTDTEQYFSGFDGAVGTNILEADGDHVLAELVVGPQHHQPSGIVHGGVYATLVETTASVGASLWLGENRFAMGITNSTDFLRPVREGILRVVAEPLQQGRTMQLWQVSISDEQHRPVAVGGSGCSTAAADRLLLAQEPLDLVGDVVAGRQLLVAAAVVVDQFERGDHVCGVGVVGDRLVDLFEVMRRRRLQFGGVDLGADARRDQLHHCQRP